MKKTPTIASLLLLLIAIASTQELPQIEDQWSSTYLPVFNVNQYGAVGDGITYDTEPIQKAINECSERGGGIVSNCVLISDDSAIKLGTRSNGDIKHVTFTNCVIRNTRYGIGLYMKDGGTYEDIHFSNLTIESEDKENSRRATYPILIDLEKRTETSKVGRIRNIVFDHISINTGGHCLFGGLPNKPIEDLTFDNIRMRIVVSRDITVSRKPRGVRNLPAPPPGTDYASVPAHFTFANVKGLSISDFEVHVENPIQPLERHTLWGINLEDVIIDGLRGKLAVLNGKLATLNLKNCSNVFIRGCQAWEGTGTFLRLEGDKTERVNVIGNDLSEANKAFDVPKDIKRKAFYQSTNRLPKMR